MTNWSQWDGIINAFAYQSTAEIRACQHCSGGDHRRVRHTSNHRAAAVRGHQRGRPQLSGSSMRSRKVAREGRCRRPIPGTNPERRLSISVRSVSGVKHPIAPAKSRHAASANVLLVAHLQPERLIARRRHWQALESQKLRQPVRDKPRSPLRRQSELSTAGDFDQ
jgi:hypothetical protein